MKLECEGTISSSNATESDIREAFADDVARGEFIILSEADEVYLQAAGDGDGPYALEYREGETNQHFECVRDLTKADVELAFLKYLNRDPSWKTDFQWKKMEFKPWWKVW